MANPKNSVDPIIEPQADSPSPAVADARPTTRTPEEICKEIERSVPKEAGDRVKCSHLFDDSYRCNWWARTITKERPWDYHWAALLNDHIRRSSFLKITHAGGKLVVEEVVQGKTGRELIALT